MKNKLDILKYLNLYLGSEFYFLTNGIKYHGTIECVMSTGCVGSNYIDATMCLSEMREGDDFKLILTAPTNLSSAQKNKYYSLTKKVKNTIVDTPDSLRYCLSLGVDMFDLIEKGLAVDKRCVTYKNIIEKNYKNEDEEFAVVEIKESSGIEISSSGPINNCKSDRSDICGQLYELIINQNVIPFKEEESPFIRNHNSVWDYRYLKFIHENIEWSIRKDTRIIDSEKYKVGESIYLMCQGVSGMRLLAIKNLIDRIKERIGNGRTEEVAPAKEDFKSKEEHQISDEPIAKKDAIVKRAKWIPDPNWQPPRKFIVND